MSIIQERLRVIDDQYALRLMRARIEDLKEKGKTRPETILALEDKYSELLTHFVVHGRLPVLGFDGPSCTGGE